MSGHLLLVTLGPIQDFIAQARRTRDLWYGSHLLSELGRSAARTLTQEGALLIFPALKEGDPELVACVSPLRGSGKPPLAIANKILAELPEGSEPEGIAKATREAVLRYWREELAGPVRKTCAGLLAPDVDKAWDEQIDSLVEFAACWAPLGDCYKNARDDLERSMAARKALRDFGPWTQLRGNVPKSSLDGARETVLAEPKLRDKALVKKYRIPEGEQLDAVGLVKRAGGEPGQFVPVATVALTSWVAHAEAEAPGQLDALKRACRDIDLSRVDRNLPCARPFPFDAEVLLPPRWKSIFKELGLPDDPDAWGRRHVQPLLARLREPFPYVACLVADGDRMGVAIDGRSSAAEHRKLSKDLAGFAGAARTIVEDHLGSLVYAGGDDVVAFLPLPRAVACADELRHKFAELMADHGEGPTLSVGLGFGHLLEGMGDLLDLGREAEKVAKGTSLPTGQQRNALAVVLDKRSGGKRTWRSRWEDDPGKQLGDDLELLQGDLSTKKVYEIARTLARLPKPADATAADGWGRVLAREVGRSLGRSHSGQGDVTADSVGLKLPGEGDYAAMYQAVEAWISRLLIARALAAAQPADRESREEAA